jgi:single-stranded-DNA-specific exonuclease
MYTAKKEFVMVALSFRQNKNENNEDVHDHPLVSHLLKLRGVQDKSELLCDASSLPHHTEMYGMQNAIDIIIEAITNNHKIKIVGDFDADGCGATAVMVRGLKMLGVADERIDYIVPSRFKHGYGLSPLLLEDIPKLNQPDLLITVDNGISAIEGVAEAKKRGMKVIVTDHHLQGEEELPNADAIINPNQNACNFPSKAIAGVGVAFYLLLGLRKEMLRQGLITDPKEANINSLIYLVAMSTVGDVVPLDKLNRTFVEHGLRQIRAGRSCVGLEALMKECDVNHAAFVTTDFGFKICPRLNAAGRLSDMSIGIKLLLTDSKKEAVYLASILNSTNNERKYIEAGMQEDAQQMLDNLNIDDTDKSIVLVNEDWHEGVIGLLASRLKEQYYKPAFIFAHADEHTIKASCRSIPGIHIRDLIAKVFKDNPEFGQRYGGHAMASGLQIKSVHFERFKYAINEELKKVDHSIYEQVVEVDGELDVKYMNVKTAQLLPMSAPWGQHFPAPTFVNQFTVVSVSTMGAKDDHLKLILANRILNNIVAVAFNTDMPAWLKSGSKVKLVYTLNANTFRESTTLQLMVEHILPIH